MAKPRPPKKLDEGEKELLAEGMLKLLDVSKFFDEQECVFWFIHLGYMRLVRVKNKLYVRTTAFGVEALHVGRRIEALHA